MIFHSLIQPRHRRMDRLRPGAPGWGSVILGTGGFLIVAAACLYLFALAGH